MTACCRPQIAMKPPRSAAPPMSLWPRTQYRNVAAVGMKSFLSIALSFWLIACSLRIERKQWLRPHMPQNQRLASGFAIDKAEMSSSSPGRIAVPSATMSLPAGSRMNPEEARPTHVACVQSTREAAVLYYAVVQGHDASMASRGSVF